jgi:acetyl esterase/lipase
VRRKFEPVHGHPVAPDTSVEEGRMGGVAGSWLRRADARHARAAALFCHGGAFVSCDVQDYLFYGEIAARAFGVPVWLVDYRLAPEHRFPAALDDCFAAYRGLLEAGHAPARLVLVGDSCGAGLALASLYRAREAGLPMPGALVALSGWLDLDGSGYAPAYRGRRDPFQDPAWLRNRVRDYLGPDGEARDPLASPARGDPSGLPPLFLSVGEVDLHRQDAERFAERARGAGVEVAVDVAEGAVHGFQGLVNVGVPEAIAAWRRASAFVERCLGA